MKLRGVQLWLLLFCAASSAFYAAAQTTPPGYGTYRNDKISFAYPTHVSLRRDGDSRVAIEVDASDYSKEGVVTVGGFQGFAVEFQFVAPMPRELADSLGVNDLEKLTKGFIGKHQPFGDERFMLDGHPTYSVYFKAQRGDVAVLSRWVTVKRPDNGYIIIKLITADLDYSVERMRPIFEDILASIRLVQPTVGDLVTSVLPGPAQVYLDDEPKGVTSERDAWFSRGSRRVPIRCV